MNGKNVVKMIKNSKTNLEKSKDKNHQLPNIINPYKILYLNMSQMNYIKISSNRR